MATEDLSGQERLRPRLVPGVLLIRCTLPKAINTLSDHVMPGAENCRVVKKLDSRPEHPQPSPGRRRAR